MNVLSDLSVLAARRPRRFLFASDTFKGTLSSAQIATILCEEALQALPDAHCTSLALADGGEGTVDAVLAVIGGTRRYAKVHGPLGDPVEAAWGLLPDGRAVAEMASAAGLSLVDEAVRNPLLASTYGVGELIAAILDAGVRDIALGIGGSATNDGGMGAASALGVRFFDDNGRELSGRGEDLAHVSRIDEAHVDARLAQCRLRVMCDVDNPLIGPQGATRTFAMQKGADAAMVEQLEAGMVNYARVVENMHGERCTKEAGAGAAGGLGMALSTLLGATMVPGVECVLDLVHFDEALEGVDVCITGEGRLDAQTLHGKLMSGVGNRCRAHGVSCVAIVGSIDEAVDDEMLSQLGLTGAFATAPSDSPWEAIVSHAESDYRAVARKLFEAFC